MMPETIMLSLVDRLEREVLALRSRAESAELVAIATMRERPRWRARAKVLFWVCALESIVLVTLASLHLGQVLAFMHLGGAR